ncbi:hypothetical protein J6590_019848 [Homalodisca vitripennis]|nr:hypothetical protein J6590_019848 [Homalodisca vitripennis]
MFPKTDKPLGPGSAGVVTFFLLRIADILLFLGRHGAARLFVGSDVRRCPLCRDPLRPPAQPRDLSPLVIVFRLFFGTVIIIGVKVLGGPFYEGRVKSKEPINAVHGQSIDLRRVLPPFFD